MEHRGENLKFILGLKLRQLRRRQGLSLKQLAAQAHLSISFLSEIEKGKKYPKPEKIMQLARALGVRFDDLVSAKVDKDLDALTALLESPFMREFPFEMFGVTPRRFFELMTASPSKAGAFIRTFLEIGQAYDMRVEQFLLAALRSYQKMHFNYFEDIEAAVERFLRKQKWQPRPAIEYEELLSVFMESAAYTVEESDFAGYEALRGFRSIWVEGAQPTLIMNRHLLPSQKAFIIGRELGYTCLQLKERAKTSSWIKVESFEQVLNNFRASYFAGAVLLNRDLLHQDLQNLFRKTRWDGELFLLLMRKYQATPEMFMYRLSQLIPKLFGLNEIYYIRFSNAAGSERFSLTKELNMSRAQMPRGIGLNEHYCRRWLSIVLLKQLGAMQQEKSPPESLIRAQRSRFVDSGDEFFTITLARPLALSEGTNSVISFGFYMNDEFKRVVHFWQDPVIPKVDVHETCERCALSQSACSDRVAPPVLYEHEHRQLVLENTLQDFFQEMEQKKGQA